MASNERQSQYERKLARQRQMELMEAAASGTAMDMELDTSSFAETEGSFLNTGNASARRFLNDEDESLVGGPSTGRHDQNLFQRQNNMVGGLNLMDHSTGVYTEKESSFSALSDAVVKVKNMVFTSFSSNKGDHNDADAGDVYLGEKPSKRQRATVCTSLVAVCCNRLWMNRRKAALLFVVIFSLFVISFATVSALRAKDLGLRSGSKAEKVKQESNSLRFNAIQDYIISESVSHYDAFNTTDTPEYHALRWIAYSDKATLDVSDPMLLQRYALAVFYYASFQNFVKSHGDQNAIEELGKQWEGVPNPGWVRRDHWLSDKGYCSWYGVQCESKNVSGHDSYTYDDNANIISVNLTSNAVSGTIPPEFKGLEKMLVLDLSHNELKGTFPPQIGRMFELQYMFLNNNMLTGTLPKEMGFLERIRSLHIGHNRLVGTIPTDFNRMYQLRDLGLENNYIGGAIPDLSGCSHLIGIFANKNRLNAFPSHLHTLTNLFEIRLDENWMTGSIPDEFMNLHHLEYFRAGNNQLTGNLNDEVFQKLTHLKVLDVQRNKIKGTLPPSFGHLSHIRILNLNHNGFQGEVPHWNFMHGLQSLYLNMNRLSGTLPSGLAAMTSLQEFVIANNRFSGLIPREIANCKKLETFIMDYNSLTGRLPAELGFLTHLSTLRVSNNKFTGTMPDTVCGLTTAHGLTSLKADCKSQVQCECCHACN